MSALEGLTQRDWFAAQALIAMGDSTPYVPSDARKGPTPTYSDPEGQRLRAECAYAQADAMLAARRERAA